MKPLPRMHRRTVLRSLGGVAVALPALEIMVPRRAQAQSAPQRYCVLFGSFSLSPDDDTRPNLIVPDRTGADYDLKDGLLPLEPVQDHVTVVSGLKLEGVGAPDSGSGIPIHWHNDPLFAGSAGPRIGLVVRYTHPTSDQLVADAIAGSTPFHSLALRVQPSSYVTDGQAEKGMMSARVDEAGEVVPVTPYSSPQAVFDALFRDLGGNSATVDPLAQLEADKRRSVLDLVDRGMGGLYDRLGSADQQRLSQHWDEIRTLETRIDALAAPLPPSAACAQPSEPMDDPPIGGSLSDPNGYDASKGYSDEESRAIVMTDLLAMAFACDLTRSATLMHTWVQSFMNAAAIADVNRTVHDSHHQGNPTVEKTARIAAWHMKHYANLIAKLRDLPEAGGSVLDNSVLIYLSEAGIGVDSNGVPNSHSGVDMMALVAGGAGGLQQGIHMIAPQEANDVAHVLMTGMNAVGVNVDTLGDISGGEVPGLRG